MTDTSKTEEMQRTSRRSFLKTSAAAAAAAHLGEPYVARAAHAQGSDTIRIGLIGCGGRGTGAAINALTADKGTRLTCRYSQYQFDHYRQH